MTTAEVTGCDASIMKNVWEIRLREQTQKIQLEQERLEKSALETINKDWQKRMTSNQKYPKRLESKPKPVETLEPVQPYKNRHMGADTGRGTRYLGSQNQRASPATVNKSLLKSDKIQRLIALASSQPSAMIWSKSWKFSKSLPQPEEGSTPPPDWGKSWQFMTLQPHIDGKPWTEENSPTSHHENHSIWQKPMRMLDSQDFEQSLHSPEWGKSWKYTKPESDLKSGTKDEANKEAGLHSSKSRILEMLVESQHHNEALSSSEWNESWKSTKPPKDGEAHTNAPTNGPFNEPKNDLKKDGKSGSQSIECWKFINRQLHVTDNSKETSHNPEWADSWRAAKMVSNNNKKAKSPEHFEYGERKDSNHDHQVIIFVSREHKYRDLLRAQLCDESKPTSEWEKSWKTTKNLSKPSAEATLKAEEPKEKSMAQNQKVGMSKENDENMAGVQQGMCKPTIMSKMTKYRNLMSRLLIDDMPYEWNEAWKFTKPQSSKETVQWLTTGMADASMVLKQHMKKRSLTDWSESWKCATPHSRHAMPSVTEWKESWFSRYQPHARREHWIKEAGLKEFDKQHPKYEVFNLPKRASAEKMFYHMQDGEKGMGSAEWKDSWKSLKHQMQLERMRTRPHRSRPFREPAREERPVSEWATSWRFTNLTLNQESDLWQQGWSNMPPIRPNRNTEQYNVMPEEVPLNGPIAARGWGESWRSSRRHHRSVVDQPRPSTQHVEAQPPRRRRSGADWEESWMVSNTEFHHDRPSMTEWTDSWRCAVFHTDISGQEQPRQNWLDESMEIQPRKEKRQVPRTMTHMSRSFDSQVFKERYPQTQWNESWKAETLQHHHQKTNYAMETAKSSLFHLNNTNPSTPDWKNSWKFVCMHLNQKKESWDKERAMFHSEKKSQALMDYDQDMNNFQPQMSSPAAKWGKSWKMANPMPNAEKGSWIHSHANQSQYVVLWSRSNSVKSLYTSLKETATLRLWGKSWRFLKIEGKGVSKAGKGKSNGSNGLVIGTQKIKTRKHIYSQIDKDKPAERKWTDCHKITKTQPRPKRDSFMKMPKAVIKEDSEFTQQWAESWRFSDQPVKQKTEVTVTLSTWGESWKFLIAPYPQQNGPKSK
ncbi:uncharacterized protein LOC134038839 [Osmerus eperlanus]|uniref:uncharacterized protein LOC134038839 n=1 Tax=Osmerus eperlanus TaxID=29151 RepID=UPI002E0D17C9